MVDGADVRLKSFKISRRGMVQLFKGQGMYNELSIVAKRVAKRANNACQIRDDANDEAPYKGYAKRRRFTALGIVATATQAGIDDNSQNNTLIKARY